VQKSCKSRHFILFLCDIVVKISIGRNQFLTTAYNCYHSTKKINYDYYYSYGCSIGQKDAQGSKKYFNCRESGEVKKRLLAASQLCEQEFEKQLNLWAIQPQYNYEHSEGVTFEGLEFEQLANELIKYQKAAFAEMKIQNRNSPFIQKSKELEKQFDNWIKQFLNSQQNLF
jgi:hypothetical protein